jgi:serine protease inhibitor
MFVQFTPVYINHCDNVRQHMKIIDPNPVTAFGCTLVKELFSNGTDNVAVSPYSIWTALATTECATIKDSDASKEMSELLRYDCVAAVDIAERNEQLCKWYLDYRKKMEVKDNVIKLHVVNAIFTRDNLNRDFKQACERFGAHTMPLTDKDSINNFVARNTEKLIPNILKEEPKGDTVLVNAVYFQASWTQMFQQNQTIMSDFRLFNGNSVRCRMMTKKNVDIELSITRTYEMVKLDYGTEKEFSAFIAVPHGNANSQNELNGVVETLFGSDTSWSNATSLLKLQKVTCLRIPSFSAEGGVDDLEKYMKNHKVTHVFAPGGLHDLTDTHNDYISEISHKAIIKVNEAGTTAAAVTVVQMTRSICRDPEFICDRPFIFVVAHNATKTILFAARVNNVVETAR